MKNLKMLLPITITMVVIWLFYYTGLSSLKYYPVLINVLFFLVFLLSCFREETVIQKIAKGIDGELPPKMKNYTRNLTYVWVVVTFVNSLLSFMTLFLPNSVWALYNGCVSYCIIGMTFLVEYPIRVWYKRKVGFKC